MGQCIGTPKQNQNNQEKQFDYQLVYSLNTQETINLYKFIITLGINFNNTFVITGSEKQMIVYQCKKGRLQQITMLFNHKNYIQTLNFFQWNQIFISSSRDSFILWSLNLMSKGKYFCKVKANFADFSCIATPTNNENFMISGSIDKTIKIWKSSDKYFSQWTYVQQIAEHSQSVFGLSLNFCGNQFISFDTFGLILIFEKIITHNWILKQKIQLFGYGYRLCYITNTVFAIQTRKPDPHDSLLIYSLDNKTNQFIQVQQCRVEGGNQPCNVDFKMFYSARNGVLLDRNGHFLNIITFDRKREPYQQFKVFKSIEFQNETFYGTMSFNGRYIITWDTQSLQIQIRKYTKIK